MKRLVITLCLLFVIMPLGMPVPIHYDNLNTEITGYVS